MTDKTKPLHTPLPWIMRQIIPQRSDVWIDDAQGQPVLLTSHATAEIIVRAVNSFEQMKEALEFTEKSEIDHANCDNCDGEIEAEQCGTCFPLADKARIARRAALKLAKGE